ncbi:high mobility group box domain-containing protein, partial [Rhodocollybia butyracea]
RPPNSFILFRSDFLKRDVIPASVEKHQQTLSRVAGEVWNLMPPEEKKTWYDKAAEAVKSHALKYPNYKF